jgi:hypothetical protein
MNNIRKKQIKILILLIKQIMVGKAKYKIAINNLLFAVIAFMFIFLSGQKCLSNDRKILLMPLKITRFERNGFYNDGRQWNYSAMLESYIKDGIFFIRTDGSDRTILLYTAPGEYKDEKKINITGQKHLVIKFDEPIKKHVVLKVEIMMDVQNELQIFEHIIDCLNKSSIRVPLAPEGRTIHHLNIVITGEKTTFGIESIYME